MASWILNSMIVITFTQTPLHDAVHNGNLEVVMYLISKGADIHAVNVRTI